jgi:hypothetical protein
MSAEHGQGQGGSFPRFSALARLAHAFGFTIPLSSRVRVNAWGTHRASPTPRPTGTPNTQGSLNMVVWFFEIELMLRHHRHDPKLRKKKGLGRKDPCRRSDGLPNFLIRITTKYYTAYLNSLFSKSVRSRNS